MCYTREQEREISAIHVSKRKRERERERENLADFNIMARHGAYKTLSGNPSYFGEGKI